MSLFAVLKRFMRYLDKQGVDYQFLNHPAGRSSLDVMRDMGYERNALAEAVLLEDSLGERMLVYPATDRPDPSMVNKKFRRKYKVLNTDEVHKRYPDCPAGFCVPLADIYNLDAYIDRRLADFDAVYFSLDERTLCRIRGDDFRAIQRKAIWYEPARTRRSKATTAADKIDVAQLAEAIKPVQSAKAGDAAIVRRPAAKNIPSAATRQTTTPRPAVKKITTAASKTARVNSTTTKTKPTTASTVRTTRTGVKTAPAANAKTTAVRSAAKNDIAKARVAKAELAKAKLAKVELAKARVAKARVAKVELAKAKVAKARIAKARVAKAVLAKAKVEKFELAKAIVAKAELAKARVAKTELARARVAKAERAKAERPKTRVVKTSAAKSATANTGPLSSSSVEQRRKKIRAKLQTLDSLPAMPKMASEIIQISSNPYANSHDLAAVIEQDPSLAAQLMRYAKSSFYGYRGEIDSLHQAISRVLGFDMVMDMALGIALGKSFRIPKNGTLGLKAFWQHAVYSAMLVQRLSAVVATVNRPRPGQAYLAGLLQNIGLLALGQLFPEEFAMLNKAVNKYPDVPLCELEKKVLGVTHSEVGGWLMEAWDMPGELLIAVREHHDPEYSESHATYANLALLSNRLLSTVDVGDELNDELPNSILKRLGMDSAKVLAIFEKLLKDREGLDYMAVQMAA